MIEHHGIHGLQEQPKPVFSVRGSLEVPAIPLPKAETITYPTELVDQYGAKAGILLYVAHELPHIPQAPMIVSEPGESTGDLLRRADETGLAWPRLFRSSAIAELDGYEGAFPTEVIGPYEEGHERIKWNHNNHSIYRNEEYFQQGLRDTVDRIKHSPQHIKSRGKEKDQGLPDEINVIVAEQSPSRYGGTYIRLPGQEGIHLISASDLDSWEKARDREDYLYQPSTGVTILRDADHFSLETTETVQSDLETVLSWHDQIAHLPEMDPNWSYQIEFGLNPPCLYQVRPFKPNTTESFTFNTFEFEGTENTHVVIGTTPPEGIVVKPIIYPSDTYRAFTDQDVAGDLPILFRGDVKDADRAQDLPNVDVVMLSHWRGLLEHGGIGAIRDATVSTFSYGNLFPGHDGEPIRVISDGQTLKFEKP